MSVKSAYYNVNDTEIMSTRTNRDIPEATIVSEAEAAKEALEKNAKKIKDKVTSKLPKDLTQKALALKNGSMTQGFISGNKYITKGALIGLGVGFLTGMYFKKSVMLSSLIGAFAGGIGGKYFASVVNKEATNAAVTNTVNKTTTK